MGRKRTVQSDEAKVVRQRVETVRAARAVLLEQFGESLQARDLAGDRQVFARRVAELLEAERTGDPDVLRQALMEVLLATGEWCVTLDASRSASFPAFA